jgi:hypothetical protein
MALDPRDMLMLNGNSASIWFRAALRDPDGEPGIAVFFTDQLLTAIPVTEAHKVCDMLSHAIERAELLAKECGPSVRAAFKAGTN